MRVGFTRLRQRDDGSKKATGREAYFRTIPRELEEAAALDGATTLQQILQVFLPLAAPTVGVTGVFIYIYYCWNEFVLALTLFRTTGKFALTYQIFSLVGGSYSIEWDNVMAATLLATAPAAIAFAALQNIWSEALPSVRSNRPGRAAGGFG